MFKGKVVLRTDLGEHHDLFFRAIFPILRRLGSQDGPMLEAKTDPKSIKIDTKKNEILKASWKAIISKNLRFGKPTWSQVGTKNDPETFPK